MSSAAPSNAAPSNAERKLIGGGRDGGGRVCCAGWLDYDVVEGTGAVQATGSEADEEVGSAVYPSGGRDGRGAKLLLDYNSVEGMGAALPHSTMRRWRPSAWWCGSRLALGGGGVARAMALSGVPSGGVAFGAVMRLSTVCPRRWGSRQRWGPCA